jgi:hypothetical protein
VAVTVQAAAVNVVELAPAGTLTDDGTVKADVPDVRLTAAPPAGAVPLKIAVQVLKPPGSRLDGLHATEVRSTIVPAGGTRLKAVPRELAPRAAVIVAL